VDLYPGILVQWVPVTTEDDKECDASFCSFVLLQVPGGLALSDSEKAEALASSFEAEFQPVVEPSHPAVIETFDGAMCACKCPQVNRH
jgi:hypothetical protein